MGNQIFGNGFDIMERTSQMILLSPFPQDLRKKKLRQVLLEKLKKFGCLKVNVQIRKNNPSAIEFYKHVGFKDDNVIGLGMRLK